MRSRRRALLPLALFAGVMIAHYTWLGWFPETNPQQERWAAVEVSRPWPGRYLESGSYWLGFSYALPLAFAGAAFRRYREGRSCTARNLALGGATLSGALSLVGCFLIGCCGSPMLAVYLSLFGAAAVPLAKPLLAAFSVVWVLLGWWWMNRRECCTREG